MSDVDLNAISWLIENVHFTSDTILVLRVVQVDSCIAVASLTEAAIARELPDAEIVRLAIIIVRGHSRFSRCLSRDCVELLREGCGDFAVVFC